MPRLAADFADLAQRLHAQPDVDNTVQAIAETARVALAADMAGVMLVQRGRRVDTSAITDEAVRAADDLQLGLDDGPCLEAIEDHTTFVIADTLTEDRWVRWCRGVAEMGIRSVVSVRLFTDAGTMGSLNIYASRPSAFDAEDAAVASIFAGHASVALAAARTESGLREAMDGRHLIGIAQGILMERFSLTTDQAFSVLRRYSQDRNMKLRAVAAHVVEARQLPA